MFAHGIRLISLVALGLGSACAADEQIFPVAEEVATYVGPLEGSDAFVAVSVSGNDVVAYVCGGATTYATRTKWFRGPLDPANHLAVVEASDGTRMELTFDTEEGVLKGALGDTALSLSRLETTGDDSRGLYTAMDGGCRTGVIVFGDPQAPSVQGTWCRVEGDAQSIFAQVTPILPIDVTDGGLHVKVSLADEGDRLLITRPLDPEALR